MPPAGSKGNSVIIPVRGLADKGILRDPSPYELDMDAWSAGANVRIHANKVERAPVFRAVYDPLPEEPRFCVGYEPSTGYDIVVTIGVDGRLFQYNAGNLNEVSAFGIESGNITITNGGTGYSSGSPPAVTFSAPSGGSGGVNPRAAVGTAVVNGSGVVTSITITDPGYYPYGSAAPTVSIHAPTSGTTATATCVIEFVPATTPYTFTTTFLGDVLYVNNFAQTPQYYGPASSEFHNLPNMECAWKARSVRTFGDYLIALNVTKPTTYTDPYTNTLMNGGSFPNMVKWSDLALDGQVPDSWDPDDPTKSTGENELEEATSPIVDGAVMRNMFVIYTENAIFGMVQSGDNNIFDFEKLFSNGGLIAPNCAVEVDGIHYCLGPDDIYRHDGVTKQSICDKRNRETIFRYLNKQKSEVCFAAYLPQFDWVLFGINTGDPNAFFPTTTSVVTGCDLCNVGCIYDLKGDTWTFVDLPNVGAMSLANLDVILAWDTPATSFTQGATVSWADIGGSWYSQENTFLKSAVAISGTVPNFVTDNRLLCYDFMNKGNVSLPYVAECNGPAYIERTGIDLDTLGSDLTTAKKIRRIYPLVYSYNPTIPVQILWGGSMYPAAPVTYLPEISFDPTTQYKADGIITGRYLAIRFTINGAADFDITGFDLDVTNNGRR